ncbi:MAG: VOC family protein [Kofleriaceae bacterium]
MTTQPIRPPTLTPRLIIEDAARAIDVYQRVFEAVELERYTTKQGRLVHAALRIGDAVVALVDAAPDEHNHAPGQLGGTPVLLQLRVDDPDLIQQRMVAAGGTVIYPVADQYYGQRGGRVADPYGHVWMIFKEIETLDPAEIQRRTTES